MFSPRQRASFIDSKIVSMVASACFWVIPRLETRMLMRSLFSIAPDAPSAGQRTRQWLPTLAESRSTCKLAAATSCGNASGFWCRRPALEVGEVDPRPGLKAARGLDVGGEQHGVDLRQVPRRERRVRFLRSAESGSPQRRCHLAEGELGRVAGRAPSRVPALVHQVG